MRLGLAACLLVAALSGTAACADDLSVTKIISGDVVQLSDGRDLRLASVKAATEEAKGFLDKNVVGKSVRLQAVSADRYGRATAMLYVAGQAMPVQDDLLRLGAAYVYPLTGDEAYVDNMLETERTARMARRGFWATADVSADDAGQALGHYGFVVGKVAAVARAGNKVYVNFGEDWRQDFTVTIQAKYLRAFRKAGLDPMEMQGKRVRVRGWVTRDSGPGVTLTDPRQIEIVNEG